MTDERPALVHVWITKYALTEGVYERDAEICSDISPNMIHVKADVQDGTRYDQNFHKPNWHLSEAEAKVRVLAMIEARIRTLRKTLAKMEQLRAEYTTERHTS